MMKNYLQVVFGSEKFDRKYEGNKIKKFFLKKKF